MVLKFWYFYQSCSNNYTTSIENRFLSQYFKTAVLDFHGIVVFLYKCNEETILKNVTKK